MNRNDQVDMVIVSTVTKAVIIIRDVFDLSSDEADEMIDAIYDKLIQFGAMRKNNENRAN